MKALLAVDLDERPEGLVVLARPFVERTGAVVDLLYVDRLGDLGPYALQPNLRAQVDAEVHALRARLLGDLGDLLALLPAPCRGAPHLAHGDPATALLERAADYDLLVVGTHGRTGLGGMWLGSVAARVLRAASCPVLVLRQPVRTGADETGPDGTAEPGAGGGTDPASTSGTG